MDWANERWIRVYTRDTGDWLMWPWQTRALFVFILRKVDRAGLLQLGRGKLQALAAIIGMPSQDVTEWIEPLLEDGCVQIHDGQLCVPNFVPAQETGQTDRARQHASRERARDKFIASNGREPSAIELRYSQSPAPPSSQPVTPAVTARHDESQNVTPRVDKTRQEETRAERAGEPHAAAPGGSDSSPEPEARPSETRLKSAPPPAPLAEPDQPDDDRTAWRGPKHRAIVDAIASQPVFRPLDAAKLATSMVGRMMGLAPPPKLEHVLQAIRNCAEHSDGLGLTPERLQRKLFGYVDRAGPDDAPSATKAPSAAQTPRSAAYVESDDRELIARIRRGPQRVTAQTTRLPSPDAAASAAALVAGIGKGPGAVPLPPIRAPATEDELREKARLDRERLAEFESKTGANGGKQ